MVPSSWPPTPWWPAAVGFCPRPRPRTRRAAAWRCCPDAATASSPGSASSLPVALRGAWRDDNTFVIEYQVIGQVERGTLEFTFEGDVVDVTAREPATGTIESSTADRAG